MKRSDLFELSPDTLRFRAAIADLSPLQREIINAGLSGDDENSDDLIADRHGTSAAAIRVERILARRRLHEFLFRKEA